MNSNILIGKIVNGYAPCKDEIVQLLKLQGEEKIYLFNKANEVRHKYFGNKVHLRGIIEFSNYCRCSCAYCGLNCSHDIKRYRMSLKEIIENAEEAEKAGYKTLVLQAGEDIWYDCDKIEYIVREIKKKLDVAITLSIGEREYQEYKVWKQAGADRYLIKHETADEKLYNSLHPHSTFEKRIQCIKWIKELGYQTGSGFMIGLPTQTLETIAEDILLLKKLNVDMAGIGPFIPHPSTLLRDVPQGNLQLTLKAVAITRIIIKNINLPSTTAFGVAADNKIIGDGSSNSENEVPFNSGANVLMKKVEPYKYRRLYEIYPKKTGDKKTILQERIETERAIEEIGLQVDSGKGHVFNNILIGGDNNEGRRIHN